VRVAGEHMQRRVEGREGHLPAAGRVRLRERRRGALFATTRIFVHCTFGRAGWGVAAKRHPPSPLSTSLRDAWHRMLQSTDDGRRGSTRDCARFPGDGTYCRPAICPPPHRHVHRTPHTAPHNMTIISILIASDIQPQSSRKTIMARPRQRPAPAIYYRALNSPRPHYFSRRHASISPATRVCRV
jgi:hypothetical protein